METLEEEEQSNSTTTTTVDQLAAKTSLPTEIIDNILFRLPVKSLLRFRSVSKPWLSHISGPSFTKIHFTRATAGHRYALFISAYDYSTRKRYYLSAAYDGGPLAHLMTVEDDFATDITAPAHLNGLVCFTSTTLVSYRVNCHAFAVNPSTRKVFKIPYPASNENYTSEYALIGYLFGFDERINDHKVLLIRKVVKTRTFEFMIFSLSSHSWRKIDVEPPIGCSWDRLYGGLNGGVCVNSVVYILLLDLTFDILAFDFIAEKFSFIRLPQGVGPNLDTLMHNLNEGGFMKAEIPSIMKINDCVGVVLHDPKSNEIHIWLLQDYDNRVWVKETIKFPESRNELGGRFPVPVDVNMDEVIFSPSKASANVMIIPVYNRKSGCFRSLQFTLDDQVLCSETVGFNRIKCYVESMMPL